jgi:hypothetical protein
MVALLGGTIGVFSPISSNIFVPSIPVLARDFHRSTHDISLAVTVRYSAGWGLTPGVPRLPGRHAVLLRLCE